MAIEIVMPRLNWSQETGKIASWLKAPGEYVAEGEPLLVVETEKAEVEVEADDNGILHVLPSEIDVLPVGTVIGYLLSEGEAAPVDSIRKGHQISTAPEKASRSETAAVTPKKIIATPVARRVAKEHGINLSRVQGTASDGSIKQQDVLEYLQQQAQGAAPLRDLEELVPEGAPATEVVAEKNSQALDDTTQLSSIRKATAERLTSSFTTVPHFYLSITADMTEFRRLREALDPQPSYTAVIVSAVAMVLRTHPEVNCSYRNGTLIKHPHINLGVAISTPKGLLVPVIHDADQLRLDEIDKRLRELVERANERRFKANELTGGTFTISNLGMFGVEEFLAIINTPEAAILAVGALTDRPFTGKHGLELRPTIKMNLSIDHRALDGADAAKFLTYLKKSLEHPKALI